MLALPFADGSFDAVLDKAAMDCFFTDSPSPWQLSSGTQTCVHTMLRETHRWESGCLCSCCVEPHTSLLHYISLGRMQRHACIRSILVYVCRHAGIFSSIVTLRLALLGSCLKCEVNLHVRAL